MHSTTSGVLSHLWQHSSHPHLDGGMRPSAIPVRQESVSVHSSSQHPTFHPLQSPPRHATGNISEFARANLRRSAQSIQAHSTALLFNPRWCRFHTHPTTPGHNKGPQCCSTWAVPTRLRSQDRSKRVQKRDSQSGQVVCVSCGVGQKQCLPNAHRSRLDTCDSGQHTPSPVCLLLQEFTVAASQ